MGRWPKSQEVFPDVTNTATHCLQRSEVPSQTTLDLAFGLAHSESRYESSSSSLNSRGVHERSVYSPLWLLELLALLLLSVVMGHHRLCMTSVTSAAIALQSVAPDFALCVFSSIRGSRTGAPEAFGASFATIFVFSCAQKRGQSPFHESTRATRVPAFLPTYCSSVWSILKGSPRTHEICRLTGALSQGPELLSSPPQVSLGRLEPGNPIVLSVCNIFLQIVEGSGT